jgi:hypothetical protein
MKKIDTNLGTELNDDSLDIVHGGGVAVYGDDYNTYKIDLQPIIKTVKSIWKKIKSWF